MNFDICMPYLKNIAALFIFLIMKGTKYKPYLTIKLHQGKIKRKDQQNN